MYRAASALLLLWPLSLAAQRPPAVQMARAESLEVAGRPWHAAEAFVTATGEVTAPGGAQLLIANASAELAARRYARAVALLEKRSWLADSGNGVGYAILAEAEDRLGNPAEAARDYLNARGEATGSRAALLAVRAAHAFEESGAPDSARRYYEAARNAGLASIDDWLRLREAGVTPDTLAVDSLISGLAFPLSRRAPLVRARALLVAGDSAEAVSALAAGGGALQAAQVALARRDSARARDLLYQLFTDSPLSDDAAAGEVLALGPLPPLTPAERIALAQVLRSHGDAPAALVQVRRAVLQGDSSGNTLLLEADLLSAAHKEHQALNAIEAAARDSGLRPLATYRRARVLLRLGDSSAPQALLDFARTYASDSAAPTALSLAGDRLAERGDSSGAEAIFRELCTAHPLDFSCTQARLRMGSWEFRRGHLDRSADWFQGEVAVGAAGGGGLHAAARYWLAKIAAARGDTAGSRAQWLALAHDDSIGYYGLRARRLAGLPPLSVAERPDSTIPAVVSGLARLDTLRLAGLDSEADAQVRALVANPPPADSVEQLLAWSAGLVKRGWGSLSVRLAWLAFPKAPGDPRVLRAIFPWPNRRAVEAEADEFHVDPLLLAALIRQESVFDREALSRAGARGLAQLLPSTAAYTARGLDLPFAPEWLTVPDLNLHLGAAHLATLLQHYHGRVDAAVASYDAGTVPVDRWLAKGAGADPDFFVEDVAFLETRGYVRSVIRNREIYQALYGATH